MKRLYWWREAIYVLLFYGVYSAIRNLFGSAAVSAETARVVGGWADGLITVNQQPEVLRRVIDAFREAGGERKPVAVQVHVSWAEDEDTALAIAHEQWRTNAIPSMDFITDTDMDNSPRVAVINEHMARTVWPNEDPLGKRVKVGSGEASHGWEGSSFEVVGVVGAGFMGSGIAESAARVASDRQQAAGRAVSALRASQAAQLKLVSAAEARAAVSASALRAVVLANGRIDAADLDILQVCDDPADVVEIIGLAPSGT